MQPTRNQQKLAEWNQARRAKYNKNHGWDAGLDALRTGGLTQEQYSNLQAGKLPGHMNGRFLGMTPEQLKAVASFVNSQGVQSGTGVFDPISGVEGQSMDFNYNDPRGAHGAEGDPSVAPWMTGGDGTNNGGNQMGGMGRFNNWPGNLGHNGLPVIPRPPRPVGAGGFREQLWQIAKQRHMGGPPAYNPNQGGGGGAGWGSVR